MEVIPCNEKHSGNEIKEQPSPYLQRGRRPNPRSCYLADHSKHHTHRCVIRSIGHNTLPNIVGPFFPDSKDNSKVNLYFASMLALLCPWRCLQDIKAQDETFKSAFESFITTASQTDLDVISGIQYHYDCKNAANEHLHEDTYNSLRDAEQENRIKDSNDVDMEDDEEHFHVLLTEDDLRLFETSQKNQREEQHGAFVVSIARSSDILREEAEA